MEMTLIPAAANLLGIALAVVTICGALVLVVSILVSVVADALAIW